MQLESTLFAVAVVEIKPQLERLLQLNADALTKEIRLTQDLTELFIEYQVPSDLLAYDGAENATVAEKTDKVKLNVQAVQDMIKTAKRDELVDEKQRAEFENASAFISRSPGQHIAADEVLLLSADSFAGAKMRTGAATRNANPEQQPPQRQRQRQEEQDQQAELLGLPARLDAMFGEFDLDGAVRPNKLTVGGTWQKKFQTTLLAKATQTALGKDELRAEKSRTFDLLDALSKSGALPLSDSQLHVVMVSTHVFDKTLMDTVLQLNVNPIEQVERSQLLMAAAIHNQRNMSELVDESQRARVEQIHGWK
jgi:hypothetical protein